MAATEARSHSQPHVQAGRQGSMLCLTTGKVTKLSVFLVASTRLVFFKNKNSEDKYHSHSLRGWGPTHQSSCVSYRGSYDNLHKG